MGRVPLPGPLNGRGWYGEVETLDHWLNGWIFEAANWLIFTFLIYVAGIDEPQFRISFNNET